MAENNRGRSPGTVQASRLRAESSDWSLAPINEAKQTHNHLTGCQHLHPGLYVVMYYSNGRRKKRIGLITVALADDMFAVRTLASEHIGSLTRSQLRIPDPDELSWGQPVPVPEICSPNPLLNSNAT